DKERAHQGYHYRCLGRLELGDMPGVYADLEAQARLAEELRQPSQTWYVEAVRATLATFEGRFHEAEERIPRAFRLGQRAQGSMAGVYRMLQLFALRREQGRLGELEAHLKRVADEFPIYYVLQCALAHLYCEVNKWTEAQEAFAVLARDGFATLARDDEWIFAMSLLAEVAESLGDFARAGEAYMLLLPYAQRNALSNPDVCTGSVSRPLGNLAAMAARWEEAEQHFQDALAMNSKGGAGPWVARTQYDYARMLLSRNLPRDRERALGLLTRALEACRALEMALAGKVSALLQELGAAPPVARVPALQSSREEAHRPSVRPSVFRREGEYWSIAFETDVFRVKDAKGLRFIARLLKTPGREFHSMDLVAAEEGRREETAMPQVLGSAAERITLRTAAWADTGEVLDAEARAAYRRRLAELEEELEEAQAWSDPERAARAREEMDFLVQELSAATGLGRRVRKTGSAAERARVNATKAIKAALVRIREHSPALARHLASTIKTGTFCSYTPDPRLPISWQA
ncbi:MAG: hypothetical protein ACREI2_13345, partial [Nitrospiraceae bacterium]